MNRIKEINFADAVAIVEPGVFTGRAQSGGSRAKIILSTGSGQHEGLHASAETSPQTPAGRAA